MNNKIQCPCCGNYTIDGEDEVITDICDVCFWQYDTVSQKNIDIPIGPNKVSLNEAKKNYLAFGSSSKRLLQYVRKPLDEELPENNE
jgi:methionyl-tRNA synthetase